MGRWAVFQSGISQKRCVRVLQWDLLVIYGDLMVIYGDLMGFTGNLMGYTLW
jgi:hypothetical protein